MVYAQKLSFPHIHQVLHQLSTGFPPIVDNFCGKFLKNCVFDPKMHVLIHILCYNLCMNKYENLNILKNCKSVCIITHLNPDTDALASSTVLAELLKDKFGLTKIDLFADYSILPQNYNCLIENFVLNKKPSKYDAAIMLDCPNSSRLGKFQPLYDNAKLKIVIDHHNTNNFSGDINIVEIVSSTCQIIYNIAKHFKFELSKQNYEKIYAGIITDTNNFSVGAINSQTFKIASKIVKKIDYQAIYNNFLLNTLKSMQILAKAIENIEIFADGKIIFSFISKKQAEILNLGDNDYDGIINKISTIYGNKLVCLVYPKNNGLYVSMRAKNGYNVAVIAKANGGGGHIGAAAFLSNKPLNSIKNYILTEFLKQIN